MLYGMIKPCRNLILEQAVAPFGKHRVQKAYLFCLAPLLFAAGSSLSSYALDEPKQGGASPLAALYRNDFEKAQVGELPEDFLVLEGAFSVKEADGNRFLELPGAPLETFGLLFGPTETGDSAVTARFFGTAKGRRAPTFAVGLGGVAGWKLQVSPGRKELELFKNDERQASIPYDWESGKWTLLLLQVRKEADGWKWEGKAWTEGENEPKEWLISFQDKEEPPPGRASVWGSPFSNTPIRFDDFLMRHSQSIP
jgi:hypothetical protein